jgi:hypothetical protein
MIDTTETAIKAVIESSGIDSNNADNKNMKTPFEGTWFFDERPTRERTVTFIFKSNTFTTINVFNEDTSSISGTFQFDDSNLIFTYSSLYKHNGKNKYFNAKDFGMSNPSSKKYSFPTEDKQTIYIEPFRYTKITEPLIENETNI